MKPALLLCGALAVAVLSGCGDVCDKFNTVHNDCGGTLNKASCENAIKNCTASDQSILGDLADCLSQPSNCSNGSVTSLSGVAGCFAAAQGLSQACLPAFTQL